MTTILILYTESWMPLAKTVLPVATKYAQRHNYDFKFICFPEPYKSDFGFRKIRYIQELFKGDCDVCWSLDLDTLITNHNIPLETYLTEQHEFFIARDVNGINAGSFIVRKSYWTNMFLEWVLEQRGKEGMHCEQDAIAAYILNFPSLSREMIRILPQKAINSYRYDLYPEHQNITSEEDGMWYENHLLLHLPGLGLETRKEIIQNTPIIL